jgi:hypothetical protein
MRPGHTLICDVNYRAIATPASWSRKSAFTELPKSGRLRTSLYNTGMLRTFAAQAEA